MARRNSSATSSRLMHVFRSSHDFLLEVRNSIRNYFNGNRNDSNRRTIIIDGVNVAESYSNRLFSVSDLETAIDFFENQGFRVKAVCPQKYAQKRMTDDQSGFRQLEKQRKVVFTPCKRSPSGSTTCSTHKKMILDITHAKNAVLISNDNFRDLLNESKKWDDVIRSKIFGYNWSNGNFIFENTNVLFK